MLKNGGVTPGERFSNGPVLGSRIEAFSRSLTVAPGTWHEWDGFYTVIEPVGAAIFQLFHEGSLWAFHIQMSERGDIYLSRRRPKAGEDKRITLAENMVGKSLGIKVRANGEDYEVYRRETPDGPYELMAEGSYTKARDNKISFRWGMYVGSRKGQSVRKDAMLFVTGATIR